MDRNAPITPEQQAAWDAFEVARIEYHEAKRAESATEALAHEAEWRAQMAASPEPEPFVLVIPLPPARKMFTAHPRRVSLRERARDIFADIKVRIEHEEAITRW